MSLMIELKKDKAPNTWELGLGYGPETDHSPAEIYFMIGPWSFGFALWHFERGFKV